MAKKVNIDINQILMTIQQWLNKAGDWIKNFPQTFKRAPVDEKAAYGCIGAGVLFLFIGIILSILL